MERHCANTATRVVVRSTWQQARLHVVLAVAAVLTAILAMPSSASSRWFMVEIIVFDDLRDNGLHAEHWPADPGNPSLNNSVELTDSPAGESGGDAHAFRIVNRTELTLNAVWNKLRGSEHYRPFVHLGWRLPGVPQRAARPVHVSPRLGRRDLGAAESVGEERPAVQGTVKVSLARYLQVEIDLVYRRPKIHAADASNPAPERFRIMSERRMRSGELHYFDHPLFGVLMKITPL